MKRIIVLAFLLSGCAGTVYDDDDDESRVHRAAVSWVGAPIGDMVRAWGEPNNLNVEATEHSDGLMRWRKTHRSANSNRTIGGSHYTCIIEAYFGLDGTITRVETLTTNCDKRYTEEELARLTR